jgi:cytochrome c-type biogenesis protein CcsB
MIFNTLEQVLIRFSFIIFFLVTLFSWFRLTIYENKTDSSKKNFSFLDSYGSFIGIFLGFVSITGLCIIRWNLSDHLPLSNLYESSLFLSWSLIILYLFFKVKIHNNWLDAITAPIILMTTTFSTLGLPKELQESTALVPALQSNWLMMHVTMMILSYGALLFGSLLAVTLLTITFVFNKKSKKNFLLANSSHIDFDSIGSLTKFPIGNDLDTNQSTIEKINKFTISPPFGTSGESTSGNSTLSVNFFNYILPQCSVQDLLVLKLIYSQKYKADLVHQIDYWSYRIIGIGFPLLTLGILSGAVWANEAWGSYWNWDPKETWALITWVIFAIYLHIRITKGWNGERPALVALLGFFVVWMCYLGVNLLGKGLHSYGWLN